LNPEAFDPASLYFESHNGGYLSEHFPVGKNRIEHGRSVSFLVSAGAAMGMTNGQLKMGDGDRGFTVDTRLDQACVVAQISFLPVAGSFFCRASFSAAELDDTCRNRSRRDFPKTFEFTINAIRDQMYPQPGMPSGS
jgi:hypothetical protein